MKSRLPDLAIDHLSAEQQRILADIRDSRGGDLSGPFLAWIHSPKLAEPAQQLGAFCRYGTCLGSRLTELVILQTAAWWRSQAEWTIHEPLARQAGLSEAVIAAIKAGELPIFDLEEESLVFQIGQSIYRDRRLSAELHAQGVERFGTEGLVELVAVFGYYALVSMTLNVFEMLPDKDSPLPFSEG
jgi:4-carboxymuconolactone decarboxylase